MSSQRDVETEIRQMLSDQSLAVVATQADAGLHASLVGFVTTSDLRRIAFATARTTRKFAHLTAHPKVAILVDNRSHSDADFHEATAVTAVGWAYEAEGSEAADLRDLYLRAHPHLRDFIDAPTCAIVAVEIEKYSVVSQFQNVMELVMQP